MTISDFVVAKSKDIDPIIEEITVMKLLIKERTHPLELLRELISNAGAREVGARNVRISYYIRPKYGHVFEVADDGCGMNFTNDFRFPGRLDRFLGLGLSAIAGLEADEFAWKGLGSKLAYQSRLVEIETWTGSGDAYKVTVNEPWKTIEDGKKPRPLVTECPPGPGQERGTIIRVYGHPPHRQEEPFKFEEIRDYLLHRTFVGFTRERENAPRIELTVQGRTEEIPFGFPELRRLPDPAPEGTVIISPPLTVSKKLPGTNRGLTVWLKGFYTWDDKEYGLGDVHLNTGLVVSVKGIPYFTLPMRDLGSGQLAVANPGPSKCCIIAECDGIQPEMNIPRSGLVDSAMTDLFKDILRQLIRKVEDSPRHRAFRQIPKKRKHKESAFGLDKRKRALESREQRWVFWQPGDTKEYIRLLREPENESDTLAILWKLEALGALPFKKFETLGYFGRGADLVVHFQEDETSDSERFATMEAEYRFFNYRVHEHLPAQYPTVVCWEVNPRPRLPVQKTAKPYKFVVHLDEQILRIYALRHMPGITVMTGDELARKKTTREWGAS